MSEQSEQPEYLLIGRVVKPHGVRGEVSVYVLSDIPERFYELDEVFLARKERQVPRPVAVESVRFHKEKALVKLAGYDDRTVAEELRNHLLFVPISEAVPLEDGEFYLYELVGMRVVTDEGVDLGAVIGTIRTGANDVLVVDNDERGEILIPDTDEVVLGIDRGTETITVHLIPGLLAE